MKTIRTIFIILVYFLGESLCAQFNGIYDFDPKSCKKIHQIANDLIQNYEQIGILDIDYHYPKPVNTAYSELYSQPIYFDSAIIHYRHGVLRLEYGYEIFTLIDGSKIFHLNLYNQDCCDRLAIKIFHDSEDIGLKSVQITLTPLYEEKETYFYTFHKYSNTEMQASAITYIDKSVLYAEKSPLIVNISTRSFLERFTMLYDMMQP